MIPAFSRKPIFGYPVMVYATVLIGFLGFGVWAHHMFAVGMGPVADSVFSLTTMLIAIPTGVKIFNWISTMWGGAIRFTTAMKFATALVCLFTIGGISGVMHASPPADLQQTDTYFIVAHFHYVLFGGSMMGLFAGTYFYFPKFSGRLMSETARQLELLDHVPRHEPDVLPDALLGADGHAAPHLHVRRGPGLHALQPALVHRHRDPRGRRRSSRSTTSVRSWTKGERAGNDPWGAGTLEWSIPSPPPDYNFAELPNVTSRYPVWDAKAPALTREVPHTERGDRRSASPARRACRTARRWGRCT